MNDTKLSPDDPRLTAYALGELDGEDRAAVEAALRDDTVLRAAVDEIRAFSARLETALAAEPAPAADPEAPLAFSPRASRQRATLLRFPQLYYVLGGLAAACFAFVLAWQGASDEFSGPSASAARKSGPAREAARVDAPARSERETTLKRAIETTGQPRRAVADRAAPALRNGTAGPVPSPASAPTPPPSPVAVDTTPSNQPSGATPVVVSSLGGATEAVPSLAQKSTLSESAQGFKYALQTPAPALLPPPDHIDVFTGDAPKLGAFKQTGGVTLGVVEKATDGTDTLAGTRVNTSWADKVSQRQSYGYAGGLSPEVNRRRLARGRGVDTESYAYRPESGFIAAASNPVSTFSADIDTASYANVRRFLQHGQLPPADAVRIEELINYFPYRYPPPPNIAAALVRPGEEALPPIQASLEIAEAPWAPGHRLVRIGLKAREIAATERGPANLVFLLDVSGSMNEPNKLPLVVDSLRRLLVRLRPDDQVAIVTYAGQTGLALASTPVARSAEIEAALDALRAEGSTNGGMGLQLAYDVARAHFLKGGINRVILCTDGDFNVGLTSEGDLIRVIRDKAQSGVYLTVLGFGMGNYKDAMLQKLADAGHGNYGYIDSAEEARKHLVEGLSGTLVAVAKDVKLQVEFNPAKVERYRLIGYEKRALAREDFNDDRVDAGVLGSGHGVTALYEIIPVGSGDTIAEGVPPVDPLRYGAPPPPPQFAPLRPAASFAELLTLKVRYKQPADDRSYKLEFPLLDSVTAFERASPDFKFAAAVAAWGQILRHSAYAGSATFADVAAWARGGIVDDPGGYRTEFVELVKMAEALK